MHSILLSIREFSSALGGAAFFGLTVLLQRFGDAGDFCDIVGLTCPNVTKPMALCESPAAKL